MTTEKTLRLNNCDIQAYVNGDSKQAIIFVHGNSSSARSWNDQLSNEALAKKYQLVSFDLPGHGKSGKSADYSITAVARLIPALVEALQLEAYIVVGLSLGTILAAEAAPFLKGCRGFIMASPNLVSTTYPPASFLMPFPQMMAVVSPTLSDGDLTQFCNRLVFNGAEIAAQYKTDFLHTDPEFRVALGKTIAEEGWTDELANLANTGLPVCIVFGKEELVIKLDYLDTYKPKWKDKIFFIEGAAHFINAEQPEKFNKLLTDFAEDAFK